MNKIIWIASYPKSGNTWIRLFLEAYITDREPDMLYTSRYSIGDRDKRWYQGASTKPLDDMPMGVVPMLRTAALLNLLNEYASSPVVKTHCARVVLSGVQQIPGHLTERALYVIRDPRDVAVSFAHHNDLSIDQAVEMLGDDTATHELSIPLYIGPWDKHVQSWTNELPEESAGAPFDVTVVRYEDLVGGESALPVWCAVIAALSGSQADVARVKNALENTAFRRLKQLESNSGFAESKHGKPFFRSGKVGDWRKVLSNDQAAAIEGRFREVMLQFGYLS